MILSDVKRLPVTLPGSFLDLAVHKTSKVEKTIRNFINPLSSIKVEKMLFLESFEKNIPTRGIFENYSKGLKYPCINFLKFKI